MIYLVGSRKDWTAYEKLDNLLGLLKGFIQVLYLFPMKYLEITILIVYFVGYQKEVTINGNIDGLFDVILMWK